jgi:hypothetical protein
MDLAVRQLFLNLSLGDGTSQIEKNIISKRDPEMLLEPKVGKAK